MLHILIHFIIPAIVSVLFFRKQWKKAYLIMIATMVVDVDHVFANPIYDANRCSVGFHTLHQPFFIFAYFIICFFPQTRLAGLGLSIHMALDSIDCQLTNGVWIHSI